VARTLRVFFLSLFSKVTEMVNVMLGQAWNEKRGGHACDADRSGWGVWALLIAAAMFLLAGSRSALAAEPPVAAPDEPKEMTALFNGKDLTGWDGDPRLWSVKDGVIHGETTAENPAKGNTFIIWKGGTVKDFQLRLSFRCNATNNSGIQYRSKHITEGKVGNAWVVRGYQHEIRNESKLPNVAGFIYDEGGSRGRICLVGEQATWEPETKKTVRKTLLDAADFEKLFKLDDWNDVVIIARGNHIQHYLNGRLVLDFTDNDPQKALSEGILALQLHAGKPMWVEFKNIRLAQTP
jgi:hypothetical protein